MKNTSTIFLILFIIPGFCQAQEGNDRRARAADEKSMRYVPNWWSKNTYYEFSSKHSVKFRQAETDDILGKWEFNDTPNTTIEFRSDSLDQTFYFYDGVIESGSNGEWRESYYDDILIISLTHLDVGVTEQLAIQVINRKTLALGSIVNGKFDYRYRVIKQ